MHTFDIDLDNISKIEGHTSMGVRVKDGKVIECKLKISENKRFFKQAIEGANYATVPSTMSRICGTCSSAHTLCSIEAVEKAFDVHVSEQTFMLRNLLINAGHLRDHAMHLYFFCLPDVFEKESVFEFKDDLHKWVHYGLDVKEAGNFLSTIIGGRAVHPPFAVIGGFTNFPTKNEIEEAIVKLNQCRNKILEVIDIFYEYRKDFARKTNYVGLYNKDYNFLKGFIKTAQGTVISEENYGDHLERVVLPYSTATAYEWESKDYLVGALARMNLNKENLNSKTRKDVSKYLKVFPSDSIFDNNLAQAIEMLHETDSSVEILEKLKENMKKEEPAKVHPKAGRGVGVVEAPRGTLYYSLDFDDKGNVTNCELCIPTQQNIIHLEKNVAAYVEVLLRKGMDKEKISLEVEKVIRAYDPCMSCATHFLKIDWS